MKEENNDMMKDILDKINSNSSSGNISKNENGALEFQFDTPMPKTGLIFEESENAEEPDEEIFSDDGEFEIPDSDSIDFNSAPVDEESKTEENDEFIIPDVFDIAEAAEKNPSDKYVSTIWKAYVPRFTDVTSNNYAVSDPKKRVEQRNLMEEEFLPGGNASSTSPITVTKRNFGEDNFDVNDPTAEIKEAVPDAVIINVNSAKFVDSDTINVFKFSDGSLKDTQEKELTPEELERREINGLIGHDQDSDDSENEQLKSKNTPYVAPRVEISVPKSSYTDIDDEQKISDNVEFAKEDNDPIPEGYEGKKTTSSANDTSEYNSFSMRDSFKDKFLDVIMSVKIRLTVAVLLGIATFVFDIFERRICAYFGLGLNFAAPAIIDACFIASIFLITLPEACRGVRQLAFGIVSPELLGVISGVSIFVYAVAMAAIAPVGGGYPLLASVYVVIAINSIYATHCLQKSNFMAFKVVSEKGNKSVVDKPYTRTLELENMALDGVIDEYKSKCARVFKTSFVSGFYSNASKNSEKSKNNIIILLISFGVALVGGTVMLFVKGPVSALSTFGIVISLSMPAFSVLSHKAPYCAVQKEALSESGAVIGEKALSEYADVDVIAFEDTEVFGPDDVMLKSASDRRSDYLDTMKKMASLFAAVGGPLRLVFENALNKKYTPATEVTIEDDGVSGLVEGERVMAGTAEYMKRKNVKIPASHDIKVGSTRVIYAAADNEFFATFTVHYSFSEEFALLLSTMREKGIVPLVYTRDFNINNEFMKVLTGGNDAIRVMKKYTTVKEPPVYSKINSAMVTRAEKTSAISLILASKRYVHFQSALGVTELSASAVGAVLAMMIALANMMVSLPTVLLAVWQLGWSVVLLIMCNRTFKSRKKDNKDAE